MITNNRSVLDGKSLSDVNFFKMFNAVVLAVKRPNEAICMQNFSTFEMEPGDSLLIEAELDFATYHKHDPAFAFIKPVENSRPPRLSSRKDTARRVMMLVGLVSFFPTSFYVPVVVLAFWWVFIILVTKTITINDAFGSMNPQMLLKAGLSLGVGRGLFNVGVTNCFAEWVTYNFGGAFAMMISTYLLTVANGLMIQSTAAALIMLPFA